ncbi:YcxB family protein [Ilyomonas limi]|uniref:YcxB family protein n=1 Tax=Ilyomonas limi TaxID=2575867 RepID=A0A4U3KPV8_9BACT|nr:YcxB family protein [Ilyomonas limi]TKK64220.1 YcxB family protein [Ilyomonas limi]
MQPIKIAYNSSSVKAQLEYLIKQEFIASFGNFKKPALYLLGWICFIVPFSYLTRDNLVVLKGVLLSLTALAVFLAIGLSIPILIKFLKRNAWKRKTLLNLSKNDQYYFLSFDDDQISISTDMYNTNIKWNYYNYYTEFNDSLYLIPKSFYEAIACSRLELGDDSYERLKAILSTKLLPFE